MYPAGTSAPLPDELVHGRQCLEEGKVFSTLLHRWQIYVCRLASHVLGIGCTTYGAIKFRLAVSARYADGTKLVPQGL